MGSEKKEWKKLLEESRRLEKESLMSDEELKQRQETVVKEAELLKKMLHEQWFVQDVDVDKKKKGKKK